MANKQSKGVTTVASIATVAIIVLGAVPFELIEKAGPWAGWLVAATIARKLWNAATLVSYHEQRDAAFVAHVAQLREQNAELAQSLQRAFTANAQQAETIRAWRVVAKQEGWSDDGIKTVRFEPMRPPPLPPPDDD
jgi:hypothetical protein